MTVGRNLPVELDELAKCVSCGLCLAHCPTFRVTGEEALSPRGRISAMRAVEEGAPADDAFVEIVQSCVVCRACETACPSAVPFGHLMEAAREVTADRAVPWWQRLAYRTLEYPRLLTALTTVGAAAQRARLVPPGLARRAGLPARLPLRQAPLRATGSDVWLFTGCVMDAWQRPVHAATIAVLEAMGVGVALAGTSGGAPAGASSGAAGAAGGASSGASTGGAPAGASSGCCGALHSHAGLSDRARVLARRVMASFPGDAPILVDSAGCGAAMKEYGHLLGTDSARRFAARVYDVQEWIAGHADRLPPATDGQWLPGSGVSSRPVRIAVQDPCHLRHAQRVEAQVRTVLRPYGQLVELTDEGRCCGAGGAYSALRPEMAGAIRSQKVAVIATAGADVVASANPGCSMWLAGAGVPTMHPMEIIARAAGLDFEGA